jgi:RNA recognition motif-containing protein
MATEEDAKKAIEMWNGKEVEGRTLSVDEARPMEPRAPRKDFNRRGGRDFGGGRNNW